MTTEQEQEINKLRHDVHNLARKLSMAESEIGNQRSDINRLRERLDDLTGTSDGLNVERSRPT